VRHAEPAKRVVLVDHVDRGPVGHARHHQVGELGEHLVGVERRCKKLTRKGQNVARRLRTASVRHIPEEPDPALRYSGVVSYWTREALEHAAVAKEQLLMALDERVRVEIFGPLGKFAWVDELVLDRSQRQVAATSRFDIRRNSPDFEETLVVVDDLAIGRHDDDRVDG